MATKKATQHSLSAEEVGNSFVEEYYNLLYHSPEKVYQFYKDKSMLSRPDPNGFMALVTTMKLINDRICSLDYKNSRAEIRTIDAEKSCNGGVIILVTGYFTGRDKRKRIFTQTFFLAPQEIGYFVLNDIFRYAEECECDKLVRTITGIDYAPAPVTQDSGACQNVQSGYDLLDEERQANDKKEIVVEAYQSHHSNRKHISAKSETTTAVRVDAPKRFHAFVESSEVQARPVTTYVPASTSKLTPTTNEKNSFDSKPEAPAQTPDASTFIASSSVAVPRSNGAQDEVGRYSIKVTNLPQRFKYCELVTELKKFGPIKRNGVYLHTRQRDRCFAFADFQDLRSLENAIQASPVSIGGRLCSIEMRRHRRQCTEALQSKGSRVQKISRQVYVRRDSINHNDSGC